MTTTLSIRIDRELKEDVEDLLSDLGLNVTTAITCFFRKMQDVQGIPFAIGRTESPREITLKAIEEAKRVARDPRAPSCDDPAKLHDFLLS